MKKVSAFAPATVANVAVGFDILGFAIDAIGEIATVEKLVDKATVEISPIQKFPELPLEPEKNTASAGLLQLIQDKKLNFGFRISLKKNIPIGSGLGGSAASAVATITAANQFLKKRLSFEELLRYALIGEEVASGSRHADNVGPCLLGGFVLAKKNPQNELTLLKFKYPQNLHCVVLLPELSIKTKEARGILSQLVPLDHFVEQSANLGGFIIGCQTNNFKLISESLKDVVIEPQRSHLIPGLKALQESALRAGALGCSISGSGPAIFALAKSRTIAIKVKTEMLRTAKVNSLPIQGAWVSSVSKKGARILRGKT